MRAAQWTAATVSMLGAVAVYLIVDNTWMWWIAPLGAVPFLLLLARRAEEKGFDRDPGHFSGGDSGPWTPP